MVTKQNLHTTFIGLGCLVLLFGVFMAWYGFPKIVDTKIKKALSLENGSESYQIFKVIPFPLKMRVYIFHVENPDDVQNGGNPVLKEMGPYVYDEYRLRENIVANEDADTLTYVLKKYYFFNKKESGCRSEEDYVCVLNAGLVGTALAVNELFPSALDTVSEAVPYLFPDIKDIFLRVKVKDLLFDGLLLDCSSEKIAFVCSAMKTTAPSTIRVHENGRDYLFSMFHHLNGTEEGPYTIGRGMKNTSRGEIYMYENSSTLDDTWKAPECNMLNGTDSTIFSPQKEPISTLYIFSSDLCRSVYIEFVEKRTVFGIPVYRYENTEQVLDTIEENDCFCPRGNDENYRRIIKCTPKGTMDLMPCMKAPIIYSNPHFYLGDRRLLNFVIGLKPNKTLHENFMNLDPLTGSPVYGMKRAQFNLYLKRLENFEILSNVSEGLMPLVWLEEGAKLPPVLLEKIRDAYSQLRTVEIIKWLIISIGLLFILIAAILYVRKNKVWCSNNTRVEQFVEAARNNQNNNRTGIDNKPHATVNTVEQYNATINYPGLYPQLINRNVNIGPKRFNEDRILF